MANSTTALPRVAIATGDPAGIGPETSLKAALDPQVRAICVASPAALIAALRVVTGNSLRQSGLG